MDGIYYLSRIPLPQWVLEEMDKVPDLSYTNRY
jgi:beta-amylase